MTSSDSLPCLTLTLFGPFTAQLADGTSLPQLRNRKGLRLLALLALRQGCDVERSWLAGTLWPESREEDALHSLRQLLSQMRRALGSEVARLCSPTTRTLRLELGGTSVDALAFDAAIARGDTASLEKAVALYRGPLLEGWTDEWVFQERQARELAYAQALERLTEVARAEGNHSAAARYITRAAAADPLRESAQRTLMEVLAASGDYAAATRVYRELRMLLHRELNAVPAPETTALYEAIRDETRRKAADVRGHALTPDDEKKQDDASSSLLTCPVSRTALRNPPSLPQPLTPLVGREQEVAEIQSWLATARLVTLTGAGGVGKTRLAIQVAHKLAGDTLEAGPAFAGAAFVDLASSADVGLVPQRVAAALGVIEEPGRPLLDTLLVALRPRQFLLVLDNCEHLAEACAALAQALLEGCSALRILATSRHALGLTGEVAWRVPSLSLPDAGGLQPFETLAQYSGIRLFVERARAAQPGFALTRQNVGAVLEVCHRLDGIPLAIELAAAWARALSVQQIASRLVDGFRLLRGGCRGLLPRHQTLAATFNWSWDLLSPAEQALLRRLSVFVGGWTLDEAEAVCGECGGGSAERGTGELLGVDPSQLPPDIPHSDFLDLVTSLVDKSLAIYEAHDAAATPDSPRYRLLEPVRQYAAEQLLASEESETTRDRHRDYFLAWAEEVKPKLWHPDQSLWFRRLEVEHGNLRAALEWSRASGDAAEDLRLGVALSRFWDTYGHLREGRAHLEVALARMPSDLPHALRSDALIHAGWMAFAAGDHHAARSHYEAALAILREQGDQNTAYRVLNLLALLATEEGDLSAARGLYEESLMLYQALGKPEPPCLTLANLGSLALRQGDFEAARDYLARGAAAYERVGDPQSLGLVLLDLAALDYAQERFGEAREHGAASLRLLRDCGAVVDIPRALELTALLAHAIAEWNRVARLLAAAERLRETAGVPLPAHAALQCARASAVAQSALGAEDFAAALTAGRTMDLEQAITIALRELETGEAWTEGRGPGTGRPQEGEESGPRNRLRK